MSNGEKHVTWLFRLYRVYTTQLCCNLWINFIRIPMKQPGRTTNTGSRKDDRNIQSKCSLNSFPLFLSFLFLLAPLSLNARSCCMWLYLSLCVSGILVSVFRLLGSLRQVDSKNMFDMFASSGLFEGKNSPGFLVQTFGFSNTWRFPHPPKYGWYLNHKG